MLIAVQPEYSKVMFLKVAKLNQGHISAIRVNKDSGKACYDEVKLGKFKFGIQFSRSAHVFSEYHIHIINLVLMSPEIATSAPWRNVFGEQYLKANLCSIAVDESHCIVEWLVKLM